MKSCDSYKSVKAPAMTQAQRQAKRKAKLLQSDIDKRAILKELAKSVDRVDLGLNDCVDVYDIVRKLITAYPV